ncbi:hypothetical protein FFZ77_13015 [Streptomyces katsurahamanus]|uniref:Uncharacterized protein n=1 Tax=Streptomyces katsurahamanus TaxID=2577098 RepID=A0ABW9NT83_9ACTN|nr:hypothetical protein [Streptomyces katsurahamanus]
MTSPWIFCSPPSRPSRLSPGWRAPAAVARSPSGSDCSPRRAGSISTSPRPNSTAPPPSPHPHPPPYPYLSTAPPHPPPTR